MAVDKDGESPTETHRLEKTKLSELEGVELKEPVFEHD